MLTDNTKPDPNPILDLISAFRRSQILFTACELKLFDQLEKQSLSCSQLAAELSLNEDALERLLGGCVLLGLLACDDGRYGNTPAAQTYLTANSHHQLLGYINYSNTVLWKLWDNLPDAIREGTHRWKQTFGTDGPIFSQIFRTEADRREFTFGMHSYGLISSPQVVNAVDLSAAKTFCDLGGATGHLTVAACERWPGLRGIVFDMPEVIPHTQVVVMDSHVADRITIIGGDFFHDELPSADVYGVGRILHDWTEQKILKLLHRVYDALPPEGALLIAEKVLHDDKAGPEWSVLQSLNMLLVTEGKERTLAEYAALLRKVGFAQITCVRTSSPLDVILARKSAT